MNKHHEPICFDMGWWFDSGMKVPTPAIFFLEDRQDAHSAYRSGEWRCHTPRGSEGAGNGERRLCIGIRQWGTILDDILSHGSRDASAPA